MTVGPQRWEQHQRDAEAGGPQRGLSGWDPRQKKQGRGWAVNEDDAGGKGVLDVLGSSIREHRLHPGRKEGPLRVSKDGNHTIRLELWNILCDRRWIGRTGEWRSG